MDKLNRRTSHRAVMALILVLTGLLLVSSLEATAAELGGKWPNPKTTYYADLHGHDGYDDPVTNGAKSWGNNTAFKITTASSANAKVAVSVDEYGVTDWFGVGIPGPNTTSGTYTYGTILVNTTWLNDRHFNCASLGQASCDYNADGKPKRRCTIVHEFGHIAGLAHTGSGTNRIMNVDHGQRCHVKDLVSPTSHDSDDIDDIY